jgi:hypothetical protein
MASTDLCTVGYLSRNDLPPCIASTTANDTLSGLAARDGVTPVAGQTVCAFAQTSAVDNGPWVAAAGAWTRPAWFAVGQVFDPGAAYVQVVFGTARTKEHWILYDSGAVGTPFTVGTDTLGATVASDYDGTVLTSGAHAMLADLDLGGFGAVDIATIQGSGGAVTMDATTLVCADDNGIALGGYTLQYSTGSTRLELLHVSGAQLIMNDNGSVSLAATSSGDGAALTASGAVEIFSSTGHVLIDSTAATSLGRVKVDGVDVGFFADATFGSFSNTTTTDATITTLGTYTAVDGAVYRVECTATAIRSNDAEGASYRRETTFRCLAGSCSVLGTPDVDDDEDVAAWDLTLDSTALTIRVRFTGAAATTIDSRANCSVTLVL